MEDSSKDFISDLPDQILLKILSVLSLKEAIKTTSLSNYWRILCSPQEIYPQINSDQIHQLLAKFLVSYQFPEILKFPIKHSEQTITQSLSMVATKGVSKELHINFLEEQSKKQSKKQSIEQSMEQSKKQSKPKGNFNLKLEANPENPLTNISKIPSFSSLKILNLRSVTVLSANVVNALFSNFVCLEKLKIENCAGLKRLDVEMGCSLKELRVVDCPDLEDLSVRAPNLRSFLYRGAIARIELKDAHKLFDAMLDMRDGLGGNGFDCEEVLVLLESLKDVEVLTLSGWLLEWLNSAGVIFEKLGFRFNKLKELQWTESYINRRRRDSLGFFLDICPYLEVLHINIGGRETRRDCPHFHFYWHEPYFEVDYTILKKKSLQVKSLQVIKIKGFKKEEDELLLLDLLLNKAMLLKSMSVQFVDNKNPWEVVKIPLTQLHVATNKQPQQRAILSPLKDYYLGFVKETNCKVSPFHCIKSILS